MGEYPTESDLKKIQDWPVESTDDCHDLLAFVETIWWMADWGWSCEDSVNSYDEPVTLYTVSTAGWSGNEDIISEMEGNRMFWSMAWQSTRRGGHYEFVLPRRSGK